MDPPGPYAGAKGFRFVRRQYPRGPACLGIGDQEMCEKLGFARVGPRLRVTVSKGAAAGQQGTTFEYTGDCSVLALEFARGKGSLGPDGGGDGRSARGARLRVGRAAPTNLSRKHDARRRRLDSRRVTARYRSRRRRRGRCRR